MWIDADAIIKAAAFVTALGVLGGVAVSLYKASERDRKQSEIIKEMMDEQSLICCALQGLIEQGCNGPCKDALEKLNKHLNQEAHHNDL